MHTHPAVVHTAAEQRRQAFLGAAARHRQASSAVIGQAQPARPGARQFAALALTRIIPVALAALLVLPLAAATQPAEAGKNKKFKTVTKTFSSSGQIDIPGAGTQGPANPYPATINVNVFKKFKKAQVKDVNLTLRDYNHDFPDNVDVMLVLGNRRATVMSDVGGGADAVDLDLVIDDEAAVVLPDAAALSSGAFSPFNAVANDAFSAPAPAQNANVALSTFNGANADGKWQLFVLDDANASVGNFSGGWSLEITVKVKEDKKDKKKNKKD